MAQGGNGKFQLKWPWNWLVCGIFVVGAGWFIGYLWSALLAAAFLWWQKKQHPDQVPQGGYCLDRTRKRLARLLWALLYLLIGLAGGVCFYMQMQEDRGGWELKDWAFTIFSVVLCLGGTALGLYEAFTDLRDAFFPAKSRLANSIRAQLPYPDEAPGVSELFAMVDRDIQANGQWFDRVAIGREWVLGDDASFIPRIRGVFARDEIKTRMTNGRRQSTRIIELYIVDDRRQVQCTGLRKPAELKAAVDCLRLRAPEAYFGSYQAYSGFIGQSEEDWQALENSFRRRRESRQDRTEEQTRSQAGSNPDFVLVDLWGQRTSRFDRRTVEDQLTNLKQPGQHFDLEPLDPIPAAGLGRLTRLSAALSNQGLTLIAVLKQDSGSFRALARPVEERQAWEALTALLERRQLPGLDSLSQWQPLQAVSDPAAGAGPARPQGRLALTDRTGATHQYDSFTRRDVELAGEGLGSGKYSVVALFFGPRYLHLRAGDKQDGRVTVNASRPDPDLLRVFETKCTHRQAQTWLLELHDGTFAPNFSSGWRDITKQLEKTLKK